MDRVQGMVAEMRSQYLWLSRTFPASKSSLAFTGTVCLLARRLPRLAYLRQSPCQRTLELPALFGVVADLDLGRKRTDSTGFSFEPESWTE